MPELREPTEASVKLATSALRDPVFDKAEDGHGRAVESAIYRMHNSEVARCYLRLIAAWNTRVTNDER